VGVDGFGAFGAMVGPDASDALFDPPGPAGSAGTTLESFLAFRWGPLGTTILSSGEGLDNPAVSGTPTLATSSFSFDGLDFTLTQSLTALFSGGVLAGAHLEQVYEITNPTAGGSLVASPAFELIRYLDGSLLFDGSVTDGGGRLTGGVETLFETDSPAAALDPTTLIAIRATGGSLPAAGRFEIDAAAGLRSKILAGAALDDTIAGDGDADGFIDPGSGHDVSLAFANLFSLDPGESAIYTTSTFFAAGPPAALLDPGGVVPEPASLLLLGTGLTWLVSHMRRKRRSNSKPA
jgi:hypothetical protein